MTENVHDKFFKENFSRQDIAVDFVREVFPDAVLAKLQLDTFMLTNNSYVDPTLEEYFADIVYTCIWAGIDITKLANQDYGLSKERVNVIVDKIKKGLL